MVRIAAFAPDAADAAIAAEKASPLRRRVMSADLLDTGELDATPEGEAPPDDLAAGPSEQMMLLDLEVPWRAAWRGMPEFVQEDLKPLKSILVHFETEEDMATFAKLLEQTITPNTRSLWFPEAEIGRMTDKRYTNDPDLTYDE